jgi:hypothetical protein
MHKQRSHTQKLLIVASALYIASCGGSGGGGGTGPIVKGIVYVSPSGDDGANGTISAPRKTISAGISQAVTLGYQPGAVFVAAGTYQVDSGAVPPTNVVLVEGVSLYGGYSADFTQRDPGANTTTIRDISAAAASGNAPNRAIEAGSGVTAATLVDGFTIQGGGGNFSCGIFAQNGSPTLVNNAIGGGAGATRSIGVHNLSSSPSIQNNTIDGGAGGSNSVGIRNDSLSSPSIQNNTIGGGAGGTQSTGVYNVSSSSSIQNNTIDGGAGGTQSIGVRNESSSSSIQNNTIEGGTGGSFSVGVYSLSSSPSIRNNTIGGGRGITQSAGVYNDSSSSPLIQNNMIDGGEVSSFSIGVYSLSSSPSIQNNTIDGGGGSSVSLGIRNESSSSPTIQNNIVFTSGGGVGRCFVEFDSASDPVVFHNNDLFGCPTALYRDEGTTDITSLDAVNALTDTTIGGNVSIDPAFVNMNGPDGDINNFADNDWHLSSNSPMEVTQGGLDLSNLFTTDKDGVTRTVPWSMGAYELDP